MKEPKTPGSVFGFQRLSVFCEICGNVLYRIRPPDEKELCFNGETAMRYFSDRIDGDALYLLDEPENRLSVEFQIQPAEYISATAIATRSRFVIATYPPILLSMRGARIYNLDDYPASVCEWTELPNVRKYFDFFMEHKHLFGEQESAALLT